MVKQLAGKKAAWMDMMSAVWKVHARAGWKVAQTEIQMAASWAARKACYSVEWKVASKDDRLVACLVALKALH